MSLPVPVPVLQPPPHHPPLAIASGRPFQPIIIISINITSGECKSILQLSRIGINGDKVIYTLCIKHQHPHPTYDAQFKHTCVCPLCACCGAGHIYLARSCGGGGGLAADPRARFWSLSVHPSAWANQGIIPKIDSLNLFHDPRRHRNGHTATQIIICNGMSVWWARWGMAGPGMGSDGTARTCRRWRAACYRTHWDWEQRCMDIILQIDSHHDLCSAWWPRKSHPHWAGRQAAGPNHNHKYILGTHMDKGGGGVYWGHRSMGWGVFAVCIYLLAGHT